MVTTSTSTQSLSLVTSVSSSQSSGAYIVRRSSPHRFGDLLPPPSCGICILDRTAQTAEARKSDCRPAPVAIIGHKPDIILVTLSCESPGNSRRTTSKQIVIADWKFDFEKRIWSGRDCALDETQSSHYSLSTIRDIAIKMSSGICDIYGFAFSGRSRSGGRSSHGEERKGGGGYTSK